MHKLKQIVPQKTCLSCDVCCRFPKKESQWRPVFVKEEARQINEELLLDNQSKIKLIPYKNTYICPCFSVQNNKCKVYSLRPFDCQLYPFLLVKKREGIYLGIDSKCPYAKEIFQDKQKLSYIDYLKKELTSKEMSQWLKSHPYLFCYYDSDAIALSFLFEL